MELSTERPDVRGRVLAAQNGVMRPADGCPTGSYTDGVRLTMVLALRRSIQNGTYRVDNEMLADRLIATMRK